MHLKLSTLFVSVARECHHLQNITRIIILKYVYSIHCREVCNKFKNNDIYGEFLTNNDIKKLHVSSKKFCCLYMALVRKKGAHN